MPSAKVQNTILNKTFLPMKTFHFKHFGQIILCFFIASVSFAFTSPTPNHIEKMPLQGWEKLGQRKVNYGLDKDEILVTAREGRFTAVKIMVKKSPINLHKAVIHFRNGSKQEINVRANIPAGGETRAVDIRGGKRIIQKVVFWYDTKGIQDKRAVVELWGRH